MESAIYFHHFTKREIFCTFKRFQFTDYTKYFTKRYTKPLKNYVFRGKLKIYNGTVFDLFITRKTFFKYLKNQTNKGGK